MKKIILRQTDRQTDKTRIGWIDFAKGIAIILVIIGHTVTNPVIRGAIFSFHMPVFFILSGITMNWTLANGSYCAKVKKLFQSLIIPAIWMLIIATLYDSIADLYNGRFNLSDDLSSLFTEIVWSSGVPFKIGHFTVTDLGMQWFLVVLFFDKTLIFLILYIHSKARRSRKKAIIISVC